MNLEIHPVKNCFNITVLHKQGSHFSTNYLSSELIVLAFLFHIYKAISVYITGPVIVNSVIYMIFIIFTIKNK